VEDQPAKGLSSSCPRKLQYRDLECKAFLPYISGMEA
jgi:hypothetical protein